MKKIMMGLLSLLLGLGLLHAAGNGDTFTLNTVDGKTLHVQGTENGLLFKELKGKVVFVEFWGTHCPPCLMSIPHYIDLTKKYGDKMAMVAIEVQGTTEAQLKAFAQQKGMNYNIVPQRKAMDFVNYVARRAGWKGSIPFLMILDQQGNFVTAQVGLLPEDALAGVIKELDKIQKKKASQAAPASGDKAPASAK